MSLGGTSWRGAVVGALVMVAQVAFALPFALSGENNHTGPLLGMFAMFVGAPADRQVGREPGGTALGGRDRGASPLAARLRGTGVLAALSGFAAVVLPWLAGTSMEQLGYVLQLPVMIWYGVLGWRELRTEAVQTR